MNCGISVGTMRSRFLKSCLLTPVPSVLNGCLCCTVRGDLVEAAVVVDRMRRGLIEETRYPRNALDVLAQQIVAMAAVDDWNADDWNAGRTS